MLRVFTLSNPRIELKKGEPVKLVSKKAVGLYIYLALNPGKHSREFLSDLFWPDALREHAAGNLRVVISNIRKNLPDFLEATNQYVSAIQDERIWIDLSTVRKLVDMGDFNKAFEIYRGDFLPGFHLKGADRFENWQVIESEKIRIDILEKLSQSVGMLFKAGDYETAIPLLKRLIVFEPLQESAHQQLMKAYCQMGNLPLAMKQFVACEEVLRRELGVSPSETTIAIFDQISEERPLSEGVKKAPHNLPSYTTKFVGRKNIIKNIEDSLHNEDARMITLLGPGGMGKTRLAMEVASRNLEYFEDGVFWIPLRPVVDANAIAASISEGIGYSARNNDGNFDSLIEHLSTRKMLLVCDNFDHLISNAKFLLDLLAGAPNLKILVTSRQRFNLQGEFVKLVGGLTVPEGKLEAITAKKKTRALFGYASLSERREARQPLF